MRPSCALLVLVLVLGGCAASPDSSPDGRSAPDGSGPDGSASDAGRCAWGGGCDIDADDCPDGQTCVPGESATLCVPVGSGAAGAPCTRSSDCSAHTMCVSHQDGVQTCRPLGCGACEGEMAVRYRIAAPIDVAICEAGSCDPFADDCPSGSTCRRRVDGWLLCGRIGTVPGGGACTADADCAVGLACSSAICRRMCRTDADCNVRCFVSVGVGLCDL